MDVAVSKRAGFELTPTPSGPRLKVWIDYEPPRRGLGPAIPALGDAYARWCVRRMAPDARRAFGAPKTRPAGAGAFKAGRPAA